MLFDQRFNFQSKAFSCWSQIHFRLTGRETGHKENRMLPDDKLHLLTGDELGESEVICFLGGGTPFLGFNIRHPCV